MKNINFYKYSSHGNHFVLLDESHHGILTESQKMRFAQFATNYHSGIGADNIIYIQPVRPSILKSINHFHHYWHDDAFSSIALHSQFLVRFFEPNGQEFSTCGNALICVALHLYQQYHLTESQLLIEIPSHYPQTCIIKYNPCAQQCSILLKPNFNNIYNFINKKYVQRRSARSCFLRFSFNVRIKLKQDALNLKGHIVYSGEPHLVYFFDPQDESNLNDIFNDDHFINHLGNIINTQFHHIFPKGINVNIATLTSKHHSIIYRCYERGLFRETLACGTGALAVSICAKQQHLINHSVIKLIPYNYHLLSKDRHAEIMVEKISNGMWCLASKAKYIYQGSCALNSF